MQQNYVQRHSQILIVDSSIYLNGTVTNTKVVKEATIGPNQSERSIFGISQSASSI